jgi:hypothetical protein
MKSGDARIGRPGMLVQPQGEIPDPRFRGIVRPGLYDRGMGEIVDLGQWREARERDPVVRLERAVARLELLLERGPSRIGRRVESELLAITGAMSAGLQEEAAERAERLAERLEHPSARLSG